jgi:uncharacterized membrane protein
MIIIWVMLNSIFEIFVKYTKKKEIKNRFNIEKVTFYIFKMLNAHISKQIFYFNMLNHCPGALFNIFLN